MHEELLTPHERWLARHTDEYPHERWLARHYDEYGKMASSRFREGWVDPYMARLMKEPNVRELRVNAYIGDYESVDSVFGTGFWRPPEVLKALRYGSPEDLQRAYLPAGDVYGFGMVLYEVLTGRIPFEGHSLNDYDLVISGHRPDIPSGKVTPGMRDLLLSCWHQDPHQRPSWTQIEKHFLLTSSNFQ
jgi:serine/threonine protein kinase